jgi:hypothetical protein
MNLPTALIMLCFACLASLSSGQAPATGPQVPEASTFSLASSPQRLVSLQGVWRFHPGDDPVWAKPGFDDSHWALLPADRPWPIDGAFKNLSGFTWYRFRVEVPAGAGALAIELPTIRTSYQLFADGVLIGSLSPLPLDQQSFRTKPEVFRLPDRGVAAHTVTLALRLWQWTGWSSYYGGGPVGPAMVGTVALIDRDARRGELQHAWGEVSFILLTCLELIGGVTAVALFCLRTTQKEYLYFGLMLLFSAVAQSADTWISNHVFGVIAGDSITNILNAMRGIFAAFFYLHLLRGTRNFLFWLVVAATAITPASDLPVFSRMSVSFIVGIEILLTLPFLLWVLTLLIHAARKGVADARLLLVPVLLQQLVPVVFRLLFIAFTLGWQTSFQSYDLVLGDWPFRFTALNATSFLYLIAVLAILVSRFARTSREQDRVHADLEAARTLQHVLIPAELPPVPGFTVQTAYHPALEVGGDFFQIIPLPTGETLAVLGDVAGKGLPAAMIVSLLVGALRSLAETTSSPAAILMGLNRRLLGRKTAFTTAIVLRLSPIGEVTLANAGHLAPYWNGEEVATEPALPLGLDDRAEFPEVTIQLHSADRLTLITDGIPEASRKNQLFGFERTALMSTQDARTIANEAVRFGQTDDITVLSLVAVP